MSPKKGTSIQKVSNSSELGFSQDQVNLIKDTIAVGATDNELKLFLYQAKRTGLDPLAKQIHFQKYTNNKTGEAKITIITAIDGYRAIADRTGLYAGNDDYRFNGNLQEYDCIKAKMPRPTTATTTVYKIVQGQRVAFSATARWEEYYPGDVKGFMWKKMPFLMLGKCAESLALRKAFPQDLSGVYTEEEMQQAEKIEDGEIEVINENKKPVTDKQITELFILAEKKGLNAADFEDKTVAAYLAKGVEIKSLSQLNKGQYDFIKATLLKKEDKTIIEGDVINPDDFPEDFGNEPV